LNLGAVPYINAIPLIRGLKRPLRRASPAALDRLLRIGELQIATAPVTTLFENPSWHPLPHVAIGTKGAARSVALFTRSKEITFENVRSIYVDMESRTSALLLKVLIALKYKRPLEEINFITPVSSPDVEAKLLIGDKALREHSDPDWEGNVYDLGTEWTEWTGLPFVFACWVSTQKVTDTALIDELKNCVTTNLESLSEWSSEIEGFDPKLLQEYFTQNMNYSFQDIEKEGLISFYNCLKKLDFQTEPFELRFANL